MIDFQKTLTIDEEKRLKTFNIGFLITIITLVFLNHERIDDVRLLFCIFLPVFISLGSNFIVLYDKYKDCIKDLDKYGYDTFLKNWGVLYNFENTYEDVEKYFETQINTYGGDKKRVININQTKPNSRLSTMFNEKGLCFLSLDDFGTVGDPFTDLQDFLYVLKFKMGILFTDCELVGDKLIIIK